MYHNKIHRYKELCKRYKLSNTNLLIIDVPTRSNLKYVIIMIAWDKRKVLNAMMTTCLKDYKGISLIMSEESNLLKLFVDELLDF